MIFDLLHIEERGRVSEKKGLGSIQWGKERLTQRAERQICLSFPSLLPHSVVFTFSWSRFAFLSLLLFLLFPFSPSPFHHPSPFAPSCSPPLLAWLSPPAAAPSSAPLLLSPWPELSPPTTLLSAPSLPPRGTEPHQHPPPLPPPLVSLDTGPMLD